MSRYDLSKRQQVWNSFLDQAQLDGHERLTGEYSVFDEPQDIEAIDACKRLQTFKPYATAGFIEDIRKAGIFMVSVCVADADGELFSV